MTHPDAPHDPAYPQEAAAEAERDRCEGPERPRSWWRHPILAIALVLAVAVTAVTIATVRANTMSCRTWTPVFSGYGTIRCQDQAVILQPRVASAPSKTHTALATLTGHTIKQGTTTTVVFEVITTAQLRRGSAPNPWEVAWVLWNYRDNSHFYALALKPNGWEVSKQDPAYPGSQRFLSTGDDRTFPVGLSYTVELTITTHDHARVDISVDGEHLTTVTDSHSPYLSGSLAAYTEDAVVTVEIISGPAGAA